MKKKEKIISMPVKKAYITGGLMSLVFSIVMSFGITALLKEVAVINEEASLNCTSLLIFPLFIVFVVFIAGFITICKTQKNK